LLRFPILRACLVKRAPPIPQAASTPN
jgi:hypothetical protein